ncbi:MAG: hypothetical protein HZB50_04340 [Chloroflexi bacterium]|nr:hypothetical protein [Chloroflexota bacterium]
MNNKRHKFKSLRIITAVIFALILNCIMPNPGMLKVSAATIPAGNLDATFGNNGKVKINFGDSDEQGDAVLLQTDGKIVVTGSIYDHTGVNVALARYSSDGSLDLTFGTNGKVISFIGNGAVAETGAFQSDGKIVIAGSSLFKGLVLARYSSNGSLDTSFGTNGVVTTSFGTNSLLYDYAHAIAIQSDGKIIAAGASYVGDSSDFVLVRYNSDGTLDTTFDNDGKIVTDFGTSEDGSSIAIQSDGKIVMAGSSWNGSSYDFAVARYNDDGSLDLTFDGDGKLISDLGNSELGLAIAVQGDGKLVVAGNTDGANRDFVLARYNSNGSLDTTFGSNGIVTTDFGTDSDDARAITIQPDGKIVVSGTRLARYNINGSLDTTFDGDGKVMTTASNYAVALQSDGKIVTAGAESNLLNIDFEVSRYNADGSLDSNFYNNGKVTTDFGMGIGSGIGHAAALQSDGKIVAVGTASNSYGANFALVRYNSDGLPDLAFGTDGRVITDFGIRVSNVGFANYGNAVAIQPNGKIVVAGSSGNGGSDSQFALARYNTNGSLDTTFDMDGKVKTDLGGNQGQGWAVAIQSDGKIIVAGDTGNRNTDYCCSGFELARYKPNGSLDTTFGSDGIVTTNFSNWLASGRAIVIQQNGKILVAGFNFNGSYSDFALARYNANGSLDTSFDGDGRVTTNFGVGNYSYGYDLALQPDGKIIVGGRSGEKFALVRYNTNGSLDTNFGIDGRVTTDLGNYTLAWAVALRPDGKIYLSGYSDTGGLALARYNADGSLDTTFDTDGKLTSGFGSDAGGDIVLQPDGKVILVGSDRHDNNFSNSDFVLARYFGDEVPIVYYVKADATGANNGSSWTNAYTDLQSALSVASSGDEIWVAAGTYKPTLGTDRTVAFALKKGVAIYGGFAGVETLVTQREPISNVTVLSGEIGVDGVDDNSYHVVTGDDTVDTAILSGFTITAGNADAQFSDDSGGGLYINTGSPSLTSLIITSNRAISGGGIMLYDSNSKLIDVTISDNTASAAGGGMVVVALSPILKNVTFKENHAAVGGGIANSNGGPILENTTFYKNTATYLGGGMHNGLGFPIMKNVTFSGNAAATGGGMYNETTNPIISNSIFWGDMGGEIENIEGSIPDITFSIVQGGYVGTGNLDSDPLLASLSNNGGFTQTTALSADSPAIDTGDDTNCPIMDQRGVSRPQGKHCDIGAYEFTDNIPPVVTSIASADATFTKATSVKFNVTFSEAVTGVDKSDFSLLATGTITKPQILSVSGSGSTRTVKVNTGAGSGTIQLNLFDNDSIKDAASNVLSGDGPGNGDFTTGDTYIIDKTKPTVVSITRAHNNPTDLASVDFLVTFSEPVTGVDIKDFKLIGTGSLAKSKPIITAVSGSGFTYIVTATTGTSTAPGTMRLDLMANKTIKDTALNPLTVSFKTGEVYIVDRAPVVVSINRSSSNPTKLAAVKFTVKFSEAVTGVDATDFEVISANLTLPGNPIVSITGSGTTWVVIVNTGTGSGTLGLNLMDDDSIKDITGYFLGGELPDNGNYTGQVYNVR